MILELNELIELRKEWKDAKVGLVTGCFDVLHLGHVSLFEFAKKHVDILLIGIESDESVRLNKGESRPIFDQNTRQKVIESLSFVDYVFPLDYKLKYVSEEIDEYFADLYKKLKITHLFTHKTADRSYQAKLKRAEELGIEFIPQEGEMFSGSSTEIIKKLGL